MLNIQISEDSLVDLIESIQCCSNYRNSDTSELKNAIDTWITTRWVDDWTKEYERTCDGHNIIYQRRNPSYDVWGEFEPKYKRIPMNNVSNSDVVKLELQTEVDINKLFELLDK